MTYSNIKQKSAHNTNGAINEPKDKNMADVFHLMQKDVNASNGSKQQKEEKNLHLLNDVKVLLYLAGIIASSGIMVYSCTQTPYLKQHQEHRNKLMKKIFERE